MKQAREEAERVIAEMKAEQQAAMDTLERQCNDAVAQETAQIDLDAERLVQSILARADDEAARQAAEWLVKQVLMEETN